MPMAKNFMPTLICFAGASPLPTFALSLLLPVWIFFYLIKNLIFFFFFWLCCAAYRILVPQAGIKLVPSTVEV